MRVTMRQALPADRQAGWFDVTIEPSAAIENNQGVVVQTNDHYDVVATDVELTTSKQIEVTNSMTELLLTHFEQSIGRSIEVSDSLLS